jgi:hypothetical protein
MLILLLSCLFLTLAFLAGDLIANGHKSLLAELSGSVNTLIDTDRRPSDLGLGAKAFGGTATAVLIAGMTAGFSAVARATAYLLAALHMLIR